MEPVVLFRLDRAFDERELLAAVDSGLRVVKCRTLVRPGELVVGRNSVLPFYGELAADMEHIGSGLINSREQHAFVADIREYISSPVGDLTFPTCDWSNYLRADYDGPVVLKSATNSPEVIWGMQGDTANREVMIRVRLRRRDDELIGRPGQIPLRSALVRIPGRDAGPFRDPPSLGLTWARARRARRRARGSGRHADTFPSAIRRTKISDSRGRGR
jgi:hypothetical protein